MCRVILHGIINTHMHTGIIIRTFLLFTVCILHNRIQAQDILPDKVYRVTAYKKGANHVSSTSNYAEVTPPTSIYIPNAFTPNGDGLNDTFGVKGEGIKNFRLFIYNRWGEKIFETSNPNEHWDGYYGGRPAEQGTYVYQVFASGIGKKARNGSVTLVR
ncbi:MAG: gliding motility-associated C-terminal domain-containing protein [Bacteroidetes bacterium]|nr:MAG: gliding motility-associated C-terminal domain-containing protein [Bacteroidota bacterium]REK00618.1 MAG: gliding motility-associated C-terminal domain-containing protein [Bacteroidota bacterium]REK35260.1 MAG: gliding motility-associated C-terminal domain-containing protein [Bacteroidota bacterium]REK48336.1 MAG: gliding motility-associated C-terminal domain-containing protein [Bacteroidota bacterium]